MKTKKSVPSKIEMPSGIKPMLCTLVREPVTDERYLHEVKLDGYRIIAYANGDSVRMDSRSGLDYTKKYPPVARALQQLKQRVILDGEVIVLNEEGQPDFDALQKYNGHDTPVYYYVFDLLWKEGVNLMDLPLTERKAMLYELVKDNDIIRFSESFEDGEKLFAQMQEMGMEGIVSKRMDSIYRPGERSNNWLKTPTEKRQEFVIGGWVESDRGRPFASLLFGAYNHKKFEWIGHAGGGFKEKDMPAILKQMQKIEIDKSPFANKVDSNGIAHWVKPELVANFKFATWTKSGRIRKPAIFLGFRNDKKAKDVVREVPEEKATVEKEIQKTEKEETPAALNKKIYGKTKDVSSKTKPASIKKKPVSEDSHWPDVESQEITSEQEFDVHGCNILINNIDRKIWKEVTKFDLLQYYLLVADDMLPHLKNRPQSLHLKLVNAGAPGMYIKDMEGRQPTCGEIFSVKRKHKKPGMRDSIDYLVCNNEATLLWMVNLGCIDINPWTSRTSNAEQPDYIIIDLDPSDDDFKKAVETALASKQYFDKLKLKAFVKTSGKTGIHLYLPCRGFNFMQTRSLAEFICEEIHQMVPAITTTAVTINHRGDKLYLDPNQNDFADTVAAPYSVRPFHEPLVSTPLEWKEVNTSLNQYDFNITTIGKRLHKKGDLFAAVNDEKIAAANSVILLKLLSR